MKVGGTQNGDSQTKCVDRGTEYSMTLIHGYTKF